jgi:L-threonylcarbamoyladenylate synthase
MLPTDPNGGFIGLANLKVTKELTTLLAAKDLAEYATNLYQALRLGDEKGLTTIYVQVPEGDGLAVAIRDRLTRAAN